MKFNLENDEPIYYGDIVEHGAISNSTCLVIYDLVDKKYPVKLVSLSNSYSYLSYENLDYLNNDKFVKLVAKSHEIILNKIG